jgi:hypothetical protein
VAVNRFWQACFGRGLVATPEDFGSQGSPPSHPELLDWLAHDFMAHGWDVKRLLKQIVTSRTYRQDSGASPELLRRDPDNRLLARAPRFRLPAEMIRDNALQVSGLLSRQIGGESVRPYELEVSFTPINRDQGAALYRRGLYTFWKRTAPAPVMMTLDASKRDVCTVRRERTSSALQALVLLNDPQFVEASRALAQRLLDECGTDLDQIVERMYRLLTGRRPEPSERDVVKRLYQRQLESFQRNAENAKEFLSTGDAPLSSDVDLPRLAALSVVANTLMSFDECIVRR